MFLGAIKNVIFNILEVWMHEKSFIDFSAQRIAKLSNSLVLKIAFIHALKCMVFCISNLDIKMELDESRRRYDEHPDEESIEEYFRTCARGFRRLNQLMRDFVSNQFQN